MQHEILFTAKDFPGTIITFTEQEYRDLRTQDQVRADDIQKELQLLQRGETVRIPGDGKFYLSGVPA